MHHLHSFLSCRGRRQQVIQPRGIDRAGADGIDANAPLLQVRRPCARERADCSFRSAVDAVRRQALTADDRGIEDDGSAIRHERQRFLHGEENAFDVDVEDRVEEFFGDLAEPPVLRDASVRKEHVQPPLLRLDLREQAIKVGALRHVALDAGHALSDLFYRRLQLLPATPRDENVGAFVDEPLRRRQTDAARTAGNECDLSFQLTHIFLLARQCTLLRKPVAEHRFTALGLFLRCLVLDYIPMLHEESVFNTQDVSRNPVDRSTKPGKPSVHDDEIPVRYDYPRFILQGGRDSFDEVEQALAARLYVRAVLDVVERPIALSRCIVPLIKQRVEGFGGVPQFT